METIAIYMRVSTQNQEKQETINNQLGELKKRISDDGHTLLPELIYKDEGFSGSILERPGLDQLRLDARDKKFTLLYYYDRGRLSRTFVHQELILEDLRKSGVSCISLNDINGESDEDQLMGGFMGLFHQYERAKIRDRMRVGKLRKVRDDGKLLGYTPKFGYDYHRRIKNGGQSRDGYFSINTNQAETVKLIFQLYLSGKSKYAIVAELHKRGLLPPKAKRDTWSTSVISRMLTDSTYMGLHYYNKSESAEAKNPHASTRYRRTAKSSRKARPKTDWISHKVPAIITEADFLEVQRQLGRNKKFNARNTKYTYLLAGLVYCTCGLARSGDPANGRRYYRCNDRLDNRMHRQCHLKGINVDVLDAVVWSNLKGYLTQPALVIEHAKRYQQKTRPGLQEISELNIALNKLKDSEARIAKMYGNGLMSEDNYESNYAALQQQKESVNDRISTLKVNSSDNTSLPLEELCKRVVKLIETLDLTKQKEVLHKVVDKVVANKEEITICGYIPLVNSEKVGHELKYRNRRPS